MRAIGSRSDHSCSSSLPRYFVGSSLVVCAPMRYVTASIARGPPPVRASSSARRVTAQLASTSLPSTRTDSIP